MRSSNLSEMPSQRGPKRTPFPSMAYSDIEELWTRSRQIMLHYTTTSPTRTSPVFNNYSPMPCSTTRTNGLLPFASSAPSYIMNASRIPFLTLGSSGNSMPHQPCTIINNAIDEITKQFGKALPLGSRLGSGSPERLRSAEE